MTIRFFVGLLVAVLGTSSAVQSFAEESTVAKPARVNTVMVQRAAIVEAVNVDTREIKLIDSQGHRFTVVASDAVGNIDQIEPRDRIITEYMESVAVVIAPAGSEPAVGDAMAIDIAPIGDKPGMEAVETHVVTATIESINAAARLVTLVTEEGELRTILVRDDAPLDKVTIGDQFRLRITTAVAVSVVAPEK